MPEYLFWWLWFRHKLNAGAELLRYAFVVGRTMEPGCAAAKVSRICVSRLFGVDETDLHLIHYSTNHRYLSQNKVGAPLWPRSTGCGVQAVHHLAGFIIDLSLLGCTV